MLVIRRIGALLLAAAAIFVFFRLAPASVTFPDALAHDSDISSAQTAYSSNNNSAEYIYGQIFAAGAASKDMLTILAKQADEAAAQRVAIQRALAKQGPDQRIPAELVLLVLGGALFLVTSPRRTPQAAVPAAAADGFALAQAPS